MIYLTSYYTHTVKKASIFLNFITLCNYLIIVKGQNSCTFYCSFGNYSPGPGSCLPAPGSAPVFQRLHLFHFICLASSVSLHLSLSVLLLLLHLPDFINHAMHDKPPRAAGFSVAGGQRDHIRPSLRGRFLISFKKRFPKYHIQIAVIILVRINGLIGIWI